MDGLSAIPPTGDPRLSDLRAGLVPKNLLPLNSFFAIHPVLRTFGDLVGRGQALAVHACGFAYTGRSHFEGQDIMQSGMSKAYTSGSGWLGRGMERSGLSSSVAISIPMPLLLRGDSQAETQFPNWMQAPPAGTYALVSKLWADTPELAELGERLAGKRGEPSGGGNMSQRFEQRKSPAGLAIEAATRMKPENGPMVGLIDFDGFDTHASQGSDDGTQARKLQQVDDVIKAFRDEMGARWADSLILTVTEFGRTVAENGTTGTDHGWASCILAAGGLVKTAGVATDWPGLEKSKLFEGRDLKVTIDANAVYAQAMRSVLGLNLDQIQKEVLQFTPHPLTQNLFT